MGKNRRKAYAKMKHILYFHCKCNIYDLRNPLSKYIKGKNSCLPYPRLRYPESYFDMEHISKSFIALLQTSLKINRENWHTNIYTRCSNIR